MSYRNVSDDEDSSQEELAIVQHVAPNMFAQYQSIPIDIEIVASPVELARNPDKCIWKMQQHLGRHFKQNLAVSNRMQAGAEDLAGNLDRMLPLGFDVEMQGNTFPFAMGVDIPGMMKNNIHRDGVCTYRLPPGLQPVPCQKSIFDAENKVSRHMYENYRLCTKEDLDNDIEFKKARGEMDAHARIAVGSLAYEALTDNLKKGHWNDQRLTRQQVYNIFQPNDYTVQVTEKMGEDIRNLLEPEVERVAKSFLNLADFNIKIHRADGEKSFTSPKKIAGAINQMAGGKTTTTKLNMDALQRNCTFYIKGMLHYLLF